MLNRVSSRDRPSSRKQDDVVAFAGGRPEPVDAARAKQPLRHDPVEQRTRVVVEFARRGPVLRMIENRREAAFQLPRGEEERPVDVRHEVPERHIVEDPPARSNVGNRQRARAVQSIASRFSSAAAYDSNGRSRRAPCCSRNVFCCARFASSKRGRSRRTQQARHDVDDARRVEHVNGRVADTPARSSPPCAAGWWSRRQ